MSQERVSIGRLKARLSEDIRRARGGEAVVITDRGRPVARLSPLGGSEAGLEPFSLLEGPARTEHELVRCGHGWGRTGRLCWGVDAELKGYLDENVRAMNAGFSRMEERFAGLEARLDRLEQRQDALEQRMDALEQRMDALEVRVEDGFVSMGGIERKLVA